MNSQSSGLPKRREWSTSTATASSHASANRHRFLVDDVSLVDKDIPTIVGHRQVTDAHLLVLVRRWGVRLVTFDAAVGDLAQGRDVKVLSAL